MGDRQVTEPPRERQNPGLRESSPTGNVPVTGGASGSLRSREARVVLSFPGVEASTAGAQPRRRKGRAGAPSAELERASQPEWSKRPVKRIKPVPAVSFNELPWLSAEQNSQRQALHLRLAGLQVQPGPSSRLKDDLGAVDRLIRFEQDILRVDELLSRMRNELFGEEEWRRLTGLVEQARRTTPAHQDGAMAWLGRLETGGVLRPAEAVLLANSVRRLAASHDYLTTDRLPWQDIARRVEVPRSSDGGAPAVFVSRVIPGAVLGGNPGGAPGCDDSLSAVDMALSPHVPDLASTTLTNGAGETLFSGLRHGFFHVPGLAASDLRRLSAEDLARLVSQLLLVRGEQESEEGYRLRVEGQCVDIRHDEPEAESAESFLQIGFCAEMGRQAAGAVLIADWDRFREALHANETVEIDLFSVSLLTWDDFEPWIPQYDYYVDLRSKNRVPLCLRGSDGGQRIVLVNFNVRQFPLSVEDESPDFTVLEGFEDDAAWLLGPGSSRDPGGAVMSSADAMRMKIEALARRLAGSGHDPSRTLPGRAMQHPAWRATGARVTGLQAELLRRERNLRVLEQAGRQLKELCFENGEFPTGDRAYKAASRIALIGYLMGATPMLSCLHGRNFGRRLDLEVKLLATVAEFEGGNLPPIDRDLADWEPTRRVFAGP